MAQVKRARSAPTGYAWATTAVVLAVASTVAFWPDAQTRWVFPKIVVLAFAAVAAALARPSGRLPRWLVVASLAGAGWLAAAALASSAPMAELWGRWPRYEGLVALPTYVGAIWLGARVFGPGHRERTLPVLFRTAAVASLALGLVACLEAAGLRPIPSDHARPGSLTGSATDQGVLGAILATILVVAVSRFLRARATGIDAYVAYAGLAFALASVVLSASRAGLAALVAGVVVVAVAEWVGGRGLDRRASHASRFGALVPAGVVAVAALGAFVVPATRARIVGSNAVSAGLSDRLLIWGQSLDVARAHLWLGVGPSGFEDAVPRVLRPEWYESLGKGAVLDSPHSGYLQVLLSGGVPLALLSIGVVAAVAVTLTRRLKTAASRVEPGAAAGAELVAIAAGALGALSIALVTSFTTAAIVALPAVLVGGAVAASVQTPRGTESRTSRRRRRSLGILLAAWAAFLAFAGLAESSLASAESAASRGDLASAVGALDDAASQRPWDADVDLIGAELLAAAADRGVPGAAAEAARWADDALDRLPESNQAALARAVALTSQGGSGDDAALAEAEVLLRTLAKRVPYDAVVAHRLGGVLILEGRLEDARDELVRAAALAPQDRDVLLTLEFVYDRLGDEAASADVRARIDALPPAS